MTDVTLDIESVMDELAELRLPQLQAKYEDVLGRSTRAPNRKFLLRSIREALEKRVRAKLKGDAPKQRPSAELTDEPDEDTAPDSPKGARKHLKAPVRPGEAGLQPRRGEGPTSSGTVETEVAKPERPSSDSAQDGAEMTSKELRALTVIKLRKMYIQVIGRETKSTDRRYLVWKIQQAKKGKVPVGPRSNRVATGPLKVLPLRLQASLVEALDDVRVRHGMSSRMELFRVALEMYLGSIEEHEAARLVRG